MELIMDGKLVKFLKKFEVGKEDPFTHTSQINPCRKYFIDDENIDKFYNVYNDVVSEGGKIGLAEKPEELCPLLVDVDYDHEQNAESKRYYKPTHVRKIIEIYQGIITEIAENVTDSMLICCVLEKKAPRNKNGKIHDGFHIHFPFFQTELWVQKEYIRNLALERIHAQKIFNEIPTSTPLGKIIDKNVPGVVWLMYGSQKKDPNAEPYIISKCYNKDLELLQMKDVFKQKCEVGNRKWNLPRYLSIRQNFETISLKEDVTRKKENIKKVQFKHKRSLDAILTDLIICERLMPMINIERADDYKEWMEIGWILFNIGEGHQKALELWIEFSKNSEKFEDGRCEKEWNRMEVRSYSLGTLKYFAEVDSPKEYSQFVRHLVNAEIITGITFAHNDIAKILHIMYGNKFVCADIDKEIWYEFRGHYWNASPKGFGLRQNISHDLKNMYLSMISELSIQAQSKNTEEEKSSYNARIMAICKLIEKLKNNSFKNCVMKECMEYFYDENFVKNMDENKELLVFENGVYDAKNYLFRSGRPDDYCTKSTKIFYHNYDKDDYKVKELMKILKKIMVDKELFKFFEQITSDLILGGNRHKVFHMWTGVSNNGKSIIADLIEKGFGDYFYTPPTEMLTVKKGQSSGHTADLMPAKGARVLVFSEAGSNDSIVGNIMKKLTGSDTLYARGIFKEGFNFVPQFKIIFHTNFRLELDATDQGSWNRIKELPFQSIFSTPDDPDYPTPETEEEQWAKKIFPMDTSLKDKIKDYAEVFMWWLIKNYEKYGDKPLRVPKIVRNTTNEYRKRNDFYIQFLDEKIYKTGNKTDIINIDIIWSLFKDWYKDSYPNKKIPDKSMVDENMKKKLGEPKKGVWRGYTLFDPTVHNVSDAEE